MCQYRPWEDDSAQIEDYEQRTRNNTGHVDTRLEARVALLEARMANVEARVERLEAKMFFLQKGMRVVCALFLVTLAYAAEFGYEHYARIALHLRTMVAETTSSS
ncbi:hypothetical protein D5086_011229 [Populus alba]|uniref:Uncharacterized protein n=1 Tax=Populus alba TaxID=43335 RepID=A0ACC4CBZ6_POPAL